MPYKILADVVVFLHFLWILFLIFGGLIGRRHRTVKVFHVSGLIFAVVIQVFGWFCPLTHLEVFFRERHDPSLAYSGSFIIHYVEKIVYLELSPKVIMILTLLLLVCNLWLYRRGKKKPS